VSPGLFVPGGGGGGVPPQSCGGVLLFGLFVRGLLFVGSGIPVVLGVSGKRDDEARTWEILRPLNHRPAP